MSFSFILQSVYMCAQYDQFDCVQTLSEQCINVVAFFIAQICSTIMYFLY